jgi:hypothetical protein
VSAWGGLEDNLSDSQVTQTRAAVVELRHIYRFRDTPVSRIRFAYNKNRAGYLAAFGERHAYLTYQHLKIVEQMDSRSVPQPDPKGELTVTVLGAGAALELYGLCLFYNELTHRLKRLRVNLIEKVEEWKPTRQVVIGRLLKTKFPKTNIFPRDIDIDLAAEDSIIKMAFNHDDLLKTEILLVYNVLNEITVDNADRVWRTVQYILRQSQKPLLILLAEPSAPKARPRVNWLAELLAQCSRVIMFEEGANIAFDDDPVKVEFEGTGRGLNDRLFKDRTDIEANRPILQQSITRTLIAARIDPLSPIAYELVQSQLRMLRIKRAKKGRFAARRANIGEQLVLIGWQEPPGF